MAKKKKKFKHSSGQVHGQFCAKRASPCGDGQTHTDNCSPPPTGWKNISFWEMGKKKIRKERGFEAHHLLCVASVSEVIVGAPDKGTDISSIVKQTDWCINKKKNMYALPLWGHTIVHYCNIEEEQADKMDYIKQGKISAPKFQKKSQHDYQHNRYIKEVKSRLTKIVEKVQKAEEVHGDGSGTLVSQLNTASGDFRDELVRRGKRSKGTHKAWMNARDGEGLDDWHKPFSMANDGEEKHRSFPCPKFNSPTAKKIKKLVNSFIGP